MARTTYMTVGTAPTPLPTTTLTTRRRILVENTGGASITIGFNSGLVFGQGHPLDPDQSREFASGDILYGVAEQDSPVVVTEME